MTTIGNLKSKVRDFARPNMFSISFSPPNGVPITPELDEIIDLCCQSAQFSAASVKGSPLQRMGQKLDIPSDFEFGDLQLQFANDIDFKCRQFFINWTDWMTEFQNATFVSQSIRDVLRGSVRVSYITHDTHKVAYYVDFFHAFPKQLSEISLSATEESTVQNFNVTIGYSYFKTQVVS